MKSAIVIMSDPKTGSEEALGRLFNGLATAFDFKQNGDEVAILFTGAGTRWASEISKADHPAHQLYKAVADKVTGVSCACAEVFGAKEQATENGFALVTGNAVPGTAGLPSLQRLTREGYNVMLF